jgi:carbamoyl-phosphate synthase large subunit
MINVIVTSAGTASAISVIKALKLQSEIGLHIIAVDADSTAAGLFLADEHFIVPTANSENYIPTLLDIAKKTNSNVLIPIYSKEIKLIAENLTLLENNGLKILISSPETIEICNNKKAMNSFASDAGLIVPHVFDDFELRNFPENQLPIFAKPNTGSSSIGAVKVTTLNQLKELINLNNDFIFQTFVDAEEVTVDVFCDEKNEAMVIAPRLRLATKSGQSVKGKTIKNDIFLEPVKRICKSLKIKGACNIQFFLKNNKISFIELNPRFAAGGLMLTVKSGANIPLLLLKTVLGINIKNSDLQSKPNMMMTRYWEEIVYDGNE